MRRVLPWILVALAVGLVVLVRAILPAEETLAALPSSTPSSSSVIEPTPAELLDAEMIPLDSDELVDVEVSADVERKEIANDKVAATFAPGRVAGRVLGGWNGNLPLEGANVTLWRSRERSRRERVAVTDASGSFTLENVDFAYWFAEASAPDHRGVRVILPVTPEEPSAAPTVRLPFWRNVRVDLVDSNGVVSSVEQLGLRSVFSSSLTLGIGPEGARTQADLVSLNRSRGPRVGAQLLSNATASWRVQAYTKYGDWLHVLVGPHVVASQPLGSPGDSIEIYVDKRAVRAALTDVSVLVVGSVDGRPLAGAQVEFSSDRELIEDVTTDARGLAVLRDVPHESLTARARSTQHVPGFMELPSNGVEPHVITLVPGFVVSGRVDRAGVVASQADYWGPGLEREPESESTVGIWRVDPNRERLGSRHQSCTTREGRFELEPVPPGTYAISCGGASLTQLRTSSVLERPPAHVLLLVVTDRDMPDVVVPVFDDLHDSEPFQGRKVGAKRTIRR